MRGGGDARGGRGAPRSSGRGCTASAVRCGAGGSTPRWSGRPRGLTPGRALDLGCGEGGDALWLAERGWQVTAVYIAQTALDRGAAEAGGVGWWSTGSAPIWRSGCRAGRTTSCPHSFCSHRSCCLESRCSERLRPRWHLAGRCSSWGAPRCRPHHRQCRIHADTGLFIGRAADPWWGRRGPRRGAGPW